MVGHKGEMIMREVVDYTRLHNAGAAVVIHSVNQQISQAIHGLSQQVDENTVLVISAELMTRAYYDEMAAEEAKRKEELNDLEEFADDDSQLRNNESKSDDKQGLDSSDNKGSEESSDDSGDREESLHAKDDDGDVEELDLEKSSDPFENVGE